MKNVAAIFVLLMVASATGASAQGNCGPISDFESLGDIKTSIVV
jgi:hypothetical protein